MPDSLVHVRAAWQHFDHPVEIGLRKNVVEDIDFHALSLGYFVWAITKGSVVS